MTPQEGLTELEMYEQQILLLRDPVGSGSTLEIEAAYFKRNKRRNEAAARWQAQDREARKRGDLRGKKTYAPDSGVPTNRPHAPRVMDIAHGTVREIKPGERPDLEAEAAASLDLQHVSHTSHTSDDLIAPEEGQTPD